MVLGEKDGYVFSTADVEDALRDLDTQVIGGKYLLFTACIKVNISLPSTLVKIG